MTKAQSSGLLLLVLGSVMFASLGYLCEHFFASSLADFRSVYYPARCLLQHTDPYQQSDVLRVFQAESVDYATTPEMLRGFPTIDVYPPTILLLAIPFAMLPWGPRTCYG